VSRHEISSWFEREARRAEEQVDAMHEEDLKACAEKGHTHLEICGRCGEVIGTMDPPDEERG
jgi:hypothetical protein